MGLLGASPPAFAIRPSIDGTPLIGQTLTGMDGTVSGGTAVSRRWLLGAAVVSTAQACVPAAAGTLVFEVTARDPGGTAVASSRSVTVAATSATALPQAATIVARWDAGSLAGMADGAGVASWTDAAGGAAVTQADPAKQPTFHASGQGGKPYVLLVGGQYLNGAPGAPASLAYTNGSHTTLFFVRNAKQTGFGRLMNGRQSNDGPVVTAGYNGVAAGGKDAVLPYAAADFAAIGSSYSRPQSLGRGNVNGTQTYYADYWSTQPGAGDFLSIGGADYTDVSAKAEVYEAVVWNKELTQAELLQAVRYGCDKYGAAYPWAGQPFRLFDGDSIMCNYGGSGGTSQTVPQRVAAAKGWKLGTYTSLAYVGQSMQGMTARAPGEYDRVVAQLGATPAHLYAMEYANQRSATVSGDAVANTRAYIAGRKAAGFARVVLGTSTAIGATGDYDPARRAAYDGYDWTGAGGADAVIRVDQDPNIGVDGTNPGPDFSDGLHPNDTGYTVLAGLFAVGAG